MLVWLGSGVLWEWLIRVDNPPVGGMGPGRRRRLGGGVPARPPALFARCDNSPGRHATAHHRATGHPLIRLFEPGEDWWWCYLDEQSFHLPGAPPAPSHGQGRGVHPKGLIGYLLVPWSTMPPG